MKFADNIHIISVAIILIILIGIYFAFENTKVENFCQDLTSKTFNLINYVTSNCIDSKLIGSYNLGVTNACSGIDPQYWNYKDKKLINKQGKCLQVVGGSTILTECTSDPSQDWEINGTSIKNLGNNLCASSSVFNNQGSPIQMEKCNGSDATQEWSVNIV